MKKTITTLALAAAATISSQATPFTWQDLDIPGSVLSTATPTAGGVLDLRNDDGDLGGGYGTFGFVPGFDTILDADVGFTFAIANRNSLVEVKFNVSGLIGSGPSTGQNVFSLGEGITGSVLASLNSDGFLTYTVTRTTGTQSVILTGANLTANGEKGQAVPDGGSTMLLLGSTLVGFGVLSRRKKA